MRALLFLTSLFVLLSCKDDDPEITNKFTYNGEVYPLEKGYIYQGYVAEGPWPYSIQLFSSGVTLTSNGGPGYFLSGLGNGLSISLSSPSEAPITSGLYQWPVNTTPGSPAIDGGYAYILPASATGMAGLEKGFDYGYGTVTISKNGEEYFIKFSLRLTRAYGGGIVEGEYRGTLESY